MNLGTLTFYDSGQTTQNLLNQNPGFEGQIWNATIRCALGSATSCVDEDQWSGWPAGFWNGATFEVFYGAAAGRTGTVSSSSAPGNGQGLTLNFSTSGVAPGVGDYLIVRKTVPGGAAGGWWPATTGAGKVGDNLTDLPPGTLGKQTASLTAPSASDSASMAAYFDSTIGKTFLQLNGTYQVQFKAKATGGSNQVHVVVSREGVASYLDKQVSLTNSWNTYTLTFTAAENGSAIGLPGVVFSTVGVDSFELDDASLTKLNGDPTNTTSFRDPVVNALRTLQPGILRYWSGQLGDTLDNLLMPDFGRQRAGYSTWVSEADNIDYGLHDFLALCQLVGAEPWFVVPSTFSTNDASNLIEYLAGASTTPYGAKRAALGQATPWTQVFPKIHLEFGNEAWNSTFKGGSIEYSEPYGRRAQTIFGMMRANPAYVVANFDLVLGGQSAYPARNTDIQNNCNNNDSFDVAPYTMGTVDSYSDNESLFGSTFAEPEALMSSSASAEGLTPGLVYQDYQIIQSSSHPVPLSFYEVNMGTMNGAISQTALNSYDSSLGAGLMVVDTMLQALKQFGIVNQSMFALPQYDFKRPDGSSVFLWGSVIDMGVTDRKRPQFLAMQLANQALSSGAVLLNTTHTGADPTWNQPLVNTVQLDVAHDLQSYAFAQGGKLSAIVFNLSRTAALPVTFSGANAPSGTVQLQQLTSANLTDTNENANVVNITPSTMANFSSTSGLTLPPYSMTVLTWTGNVDSAPQISATNASGVTGTAATVTWTTDQATSSLVNYGTTTGYGSASGLTTTMVTNHSMALSGLVPGTKYNYAVVSANAAGTTATSANLTFSTSAQAPVISGISVSSPTSTSATITWSTDQPTSSLVNYGPTSAYGSSSSLGTALTTSHSVTLSGLAAGTTYNYYVVSVNASGNSATSASLTLSTSAPIPQVGYVAFWGITSSGITISWSTDRLATTQLAYGTTSALGQLSALETALTNSHGVVLTGLASGTTYSFVAQSKNASGGVGSSQTYSFTTLGTPQVLPVLSAVKVSSITSNSAMITWNTDQATSSQVQYGMSASYGQFSPASAALTNSHSVTLTGLTSGVMYNYAVSSTNTAGSMSMSANYTFTTTAAVSTPVQPNAPQLSYVASWGITGTGATVTWSTDVPSTTVINYGLTSALGLTASTQSAPLTNHGVTLANLVPATTYYFVAQSTGGTGAIGSSATLSFTTLQSSTPTISGFVATPGNNHNGMVAWATSVPTYSYVQFGSSTSYDRWSTMSGLTTNPQLSLGWVPSGVIHCQLVSMDAAGTKSLSPDYTFVEP